MILFTRYKHVLVLIIIDPFNIEMIAVRNFGAEKCVRSIQTPLRRDPV